MVNSFQMKLAELQSAIHARHPTMPTLLQDIHRTLKAQPEQVTLLTEEEIAIIISGLELQTQTSLATPKKTGSLLAKLKKISVDSI